jgi:phosphoribosylamine--glycine ligase
MRVLIIDPQGCGLDPAMRMQADGHEVKVFIRQTEKTANIGKGFITLVDDYRKWWRWAELIFFTDNTLYLTEADAWRAQGAKIIGPSSEAAEWELDRECGQEIFRKAGIATLPSQTFLNYDKAIEFVKKSNCRYVSKPSGDADKALSYCAKSPADLIFMLERWKKSSKLKGEFILQEFVAGTEMAVGGWFGPGGFNEGWCENFEFKKLMNDDMGVATGEQGTVLRYVKTSKLARKVLLPLVDYLEKLDYIGYVDVNCIIDEDGHAWPLEFTMRPGWPTFNIQNALHQGDNAQWLMDLAKGMDSRCFQLDRIAIGVVLSIPDYPYSHLTKKEVTGIPVYGVKASTWQHLHPCEMMLADAPGEVGGKIVKLPHPCSAGDYILVMTATGKTVQEARDLCYRRLARLTMPNSPMYRTDIGNRLAKQLPLIQAQGYATRMMFSTPPSNSRT